MYSGMILSKCNRLPHRVVGDVKGRSFFDRERVGIDPAAHFKLSFKLQWRDFESIQLINRKSMPTAQDHQ
jgi:hypothetical protein